MIVGNIKEFPENKLLSKELLEAINYLKKTNFSKSENGRYPIKGKDGNDMYVVVTEYETKPKNEKKAEAHKRYIDVQFIISGTETIGVGFPNHKNKLIEEYNEEKDCMFYHEVQDESELVLSEGMFAVFFPTDIHRPGCQLKGKQKVRKAVVKIRIK